MQAAERKAAQIPNLAQCARFALGVSPTDLAPEQRKQLMAAVKDATDGQSWKQMGLELGIFSPPKALGGDNLFLSWVREHYPELEAQTKTRRDLPKDIRAEWDAWLKERNSNQPDTRAQMDADLARGRWKLHVDAICDEVFKKKSHAHLNQQDIKDAFESLRDVCKALKELIR
jgi:hypothetical protein